MSPEEQREIKRVRAQLWRDNNRERHREYQRTYRLEHLEECKVRNDKWNADHLEQVAGYKAFVSQLQFIERYKDN